MGDIALFGGTFNPVHKGHTEIVSSVSELFFIEKIIIMPTFVPPHKTAHNLASEKDRLNMCRIAFDGIEKAEISDMEIKRKGKSYTILTVRELKKLYPDKKIYVVCGGDMAVSLKTWYCYDELIKTASFILLSRAGTDDVEFQNAVRSLKTDGANIYVLETEITEISSTQIRSNIKEAAQNGSIQSKVFEYISKNNLYCKE